MIKDTVLEIEFQPVFDVWGWKITKQNEDILQRGKFEDINIGVYSTNIPSYDYYNCMLGIRGNNKDKDDLINLCTEDEKREIEVKVRNINEKYGIYKKWKAKYGNSYFFIDSTFDIMEEKDINWKLDNNRYSIGNYFETKKEALEYANYMKQFSLEWHKNKFNIEE